MFGFSDKKPSTSSSLKPTTDNSVFFHEDYSLKDANEAVVGRKGRSLFELKDIDVPVPPFFIISAPTYKDFVSRAFDNKLEKWVKEKSLPDVKDLQDILKRTHLRNELTDEVLRGYARLSGFSDAWVAVRSSVVFPKGKEVTFSGLFATELNVRGMDDLSLAIKAVYLSVFTDQVVGYAVANDIDLSEISIAVVVQKMVQAEVSGVAFTVDPVTNDDDKVSIEAVFGLGDVISKGEITPDRYVLNKKDLTIAEKHVSPQEWMKIRKPMNRAKRHPIEEVERIQISTAWSHQQKLEDRYIDEVAKIALIIEEKLKKPQDIEWVWESGDIWILQAKPLYPSSQALKDTLAAEFDNSKNLSAIAESAKLLDMAVNIVEDTNGSTSSPLAEQDVEPEQVADVTSAIDAAEAVKQAEQFEKSVLSDLKTKIEESADKEIQAETKANTELMQKQSERRKLSGLVDDSSKFQFLLSGVGASNGITTGEVRIVGIPFSKDIEVSKHTVLVIKDFVKEMESSILQSAGIIMDSGGLTSDPAILCRELKIPAVVGTGLASSFLKEGDIVKIDGNVGSIYKYVGFITPDGNASEVVSTEVVTEKTVEQDPVQESEIQKVVIANNEVKVIDGSPELVEESPLRDEQSEGVVDVVVEDKLQPVSNIANILMASGFVEPVPETEKAEVTQTEIKVETGTITPAVATHEQETVVQKQKINTATKILVDHSWNASTPIDEVATISDGIVNIDLDKLMLDKKRHPLAFVEDNKFKEYSTEIEKVIDQIADNAQGNEIVLTIGSQTVDKFRALVKGKTHESPELTDLTNGVQRYLSNTQLLKKVLWIVRRVRTVHNNRNVSLGIYSPVNGHLMKEFKKEISGLGLRRTSTFKVYAVVASASEVLFADDILSAEIDGFIVDTPRLALNIQGFAPNAVNPVYDISNSSVFRVLETLVTAVKNKGAKMVVVAENDKSLIKFCVKHGITSVAVPAEFVEEARKIVADEEAKFILGIGK